MKLRKRTKTLFLCLFCVIIFALSAVAGTLAAYKMNQDFTISGEAGAWLVTVDKPSDVTDVSDPFYMDLTDYDGGDVMVTNGVTYTVTKKAATDVGVNLSFTLNIYRQSFQSGGTGTPIKTLPEGVTLFIDQTVTVYESDAEDAAIDQGPTEARFKTYTWSGDTKFANDGVANVFTNETVMDSTTIGKKVVAEYRLYFQINYDHDSENSGWTLFGEEDENLRLNLKIDATQQQPT